MKLNMRIYKSLTGIPFKEQEVNGKRVEFHYMDETPYLFQYASKGRFAIWASNGIDYKVLIESKYYNVMEDFYQQEVNEIWLNFLEKVAGVNKKINMLFIVPTLLFYIIIAFLASMFFADQILLIMLVLFISIIFSNMIQNRVIGNKVRQENQKAQAEIRTFLGEADFNRLIQAQQQHYEDYFKFDDQETENVEQSQEDIEEIEVIESDFEDEVDNDDTERSN
jgi:ABC-type multidrug transport system fused ATPase/permease subunit